MADHELDLSTEPAPVPAGWEANNYRQVRKAVTAAMNDGETTGLIINGKRVAAIVPPRLASPSDIAKTLDEIMATLDEKDVPAVTRIISTMAALHLLRDRLWQNPPETIPEPGMADRLGRVLSVLLHQGGISGFDAGVPFSTGYKPDAIARWLRTGETP